MLNYHNLLKAAFIYSLDPKCSIKNLPLITLIDPFPLIAVTTNKLV